MAVKSSKKKKKTSKINNIQAEVTTIQINWYQPNKDTFKSLSLFSWHLPRIIARFATLVSDILLEFSIYDATVRMTPAGSSHSLTPAIFWPFQLHIKWNHPSLTLSYNSDRTSASATFCVRSIFESNFGLARSTRDAWALKLAFKYKSIAVRRSPSRSDI